MRVGAAGVGGLAVFWVLVVLPLVASDQGFLLTAALGLAGAALWLTPGRTAAPVTPRSLAALGGRARTARSRALLGRRAGASHPARVAVVAALACTLVAVRTGRDRLLLVAAASRRGRRAARRPGASPGRLALLGAAVALLAAHRATAEAGDPLRTGQQPSST